MTAIVFNQVELLYNHFLADRLFFKSIQSSVNIRRASEAKNSIGLKASLDQTLQLANLALAHNEQESFYCFQLAKIFLDRYRMEKRPEMKEYISQLIENALKKAELHPWAPEGIHVLRMDKALTDRNMELVRAFGKDVLKTQPFRMDVRKTLGKIHYLSGEWKTSSVKRQEFIENAETVMKLEPTSMETALYLVDYYLYDHKITRANYWMYQLMEYSFLTYNNELPRDHVRENVKARERFMMNARKMELLLKKESQFVVDNR